MNGKKAYDIDQLKNIIFCVIGIIGLGYLVITVIIGIKEHNNLER